MDTVQQRGVQFAVNVAHLAAIEFARFMVFVSSHQLDELIALGQIGRPLAPDPFGEFALLAR